MSCRIKNASAMNVYTFHFMPSFIPVIREIMIKSKKYLYKFSLIFRLVLKWWRKLFSGLNKSCLYIVNIYRYYINIVVKKVIQIIIGNQIISILLRFLTFKLIHLRKLKMPSEYTNGNKKGINSEHKTG